MLHFMSNLNKTNHLYSVATEFVNNIFVESPINDATVLEMFRFQFQQNEVYQNWCRAMHADPDMIQLEQLPFLPISFFKTHSVATGNFVPEVIFKSSGTTQSLPSRHLVKETAVYKKSFTKAFELFYGDPSDWCILGLLPSYLERADSSLVMMVEELIQLSKHPDNGFYLYEFAQLAEIIKKQEAAGQQVLLIGVTFALLDFADAFPMQLRHTTVMETGGMKGRRSELTRTEVHSILKKQLGIQSVHSEYGMTELLSQAYSKGAGRFVCPPWMKVLVRDEEDPLLVKRSGKGALNIIDMANLYSCAFIATDDVGEVFEDGSFEVWGRLDNSDIRGCSLMVV